MSDASLSEHVPPPVAQPSVLLDSEEDGTQRTIKPLGLLSVLGLVTTADYCLYQGAGGLSGWAVFLFAAAICLGFGIGHCRYRVLGGGLLALLLLTSVRLAWQGNAGLIAAGVVQLAALAMAMHGRHPWIDNLLWFIARLIPRGVVAFPTAVLSSTGLANLASGRRLLNYGVPLVVCSGFIALFVYANPAAIAWCTDLIGSAFQRMQEWVLSVPIPQLLLWGFVMVLGLGALSPNWTRWQFERSRSTTNPKPRELESQWYVPSRNVFWGVIVTFSIYLICEFATLWFREFPQGFYYSGYAHQGAAWLTLALLCTTLVLSAIFQGELLDDPRVVELRKLAGVWSILNYVLAISVYHRLLIYVEFNGMTFMRMIGFFGISSVVVGFSLVLWKIHARRSFEWLVQRQLLVLVFALYLLALTPVDWIVYRINTGRVLRGELPPIVQVTEQRLSPEAWLSIWPLVDCQQPLVRDGVRAHLAELLVVQSPGVEAAGWQQNQVSHRLLQRKLAEHRELLLEFTADETTRRAAMKRLKEFAYQWY